jgi:hypothetical protein
VDPEILDLAHEDLKRLSSGGFKGREADFTSETMAAAQSVPFNGGFPGQPKHAWMEPCRKSLGSNLATP